GALRPRVAHVGGAVEHAAVEEQLDRPDPHPLVARPGGPAAPVLARQLVEAAHHFLARAVGVEFPRDVDAHRQLALLAQRQVQVKRVGAGVSVADAGQALGVVQREQLLHRVAPGSRGSVALPGRYAFEYPVRAAEHAGRLPGFRVLDDDAAAWVWRVPGDAR